MIGPSGKFNDEVNNIQYYTKSRAKRLLNFDYQQEIEIFKPSFSIFPARSKFSHPYDQSIYKYSSPSQPHPPTNPPPPQPLHLDLQIMCTNLLPIPQPKRLNNFPTSGAMLNTYIQKSLSLLWADLKSSLSGSQCSHDISVHLVPLNRFCALPIALP
jgi:hypothetical protein